MELTLHQTQRNVALRRSNHRIYHHWKLCLPTQTNWPHPKFIELRNLIQTEKPLLVAVSEVKLKNSDERTVVDNNIPDFSLHPLNLDTDKGRGILVYTHSTLEKSSMQIDSIASFDEAFCFEIRLRNADRLLFGCCYRIPLKPPYPIQTMIN